MIEWAGWQHIALLVIINGLVGAMVGLERSMLPLVAKADFGLASNSAAIAFIVSFGFAKALFNLFAGYLSDRIGRRGVLLAGWLIGIPVPVVIMRAESWSWVLAANVLLGINQALTWSMTVNMKVDLLPARWRGLAVGLNEFAGYSGLAVAAFVSGLVAGSHGLHPAPMFIGLGIAVAGTVLSLAVRETKPAWKPPPLQGRSTGSGPYFRALNLGGFVMNLKDGMLWGLLPILLMAQGASLEEIALVAGAYPAVWGIGQLFFGFLSDKVGRFALTIAGLCVQAAGVVGFLLAASDPGYLVAAIVTGLGTAMSYPVLLALVSDAAREDRRASRLGVYRFWRDLGYGAGALGIGALADLMGIPFSFLLAAGLLILAAIHLTARGRLQLSQTASDTVTPSHDQLRTYAPSPPPP